MWGSPPEIENEFLDLPRLEEAWFQHHPYRVEWSPGGVPFIFWLALRRGWTTTCLRRFESHEAMPNVNMVHSLVALSLNVCKGSLTLSNLTELLTNCQLLTTLALSFWYWPGQEIDEETMLLITSDMLDVTLQCLKHFSMKLCGSRGDRSPMHPFIYIQAPQLTYLSVIGYSNSPSNDALTFEEVVDICASKNPQDLELGYNEPSKSQNIDYVRQKMPHLRTLNLRAGNGWMSVPLRGRSGLE